ncbi:MAG: serine/threonine-protein kinase [Planctomycetota bacterium]|nr:serine/threonine-protein kinase [Planctomycetota bacterium]
MGADRWRRIDELFHRLADLSPTQRKVILDAECGADVELRGEIERLLERDDTGSDLFSRIEARATSSSADRWIGRELGPYRLTSRLGVGGMGVVYRAERVDGLFQHEVAIKLIRTERATDWVLRRFEFERRTLAALQHPCIARLYDGGTTEDGCPYFVMELVRGEAIDRYCERENLAIAARLRLFSQVCRAVHFAHQSLVVHCDLKPANILIDERGVPHLLDFGIARLLENEPPGASVAAEIVALTPTLARVLTPEYASPEQLAGGPVTTSIDVYSLGVVLYELVTGCRPFTSDSRSPAEWERVLREQTPERPSTRVSRDNGAAVAGSMAAHFGTTPRALSRGLRGDLDRIVLMALRKEPERRYASALEFADDIERHLAGQVVRARGDSFGYRASKFVRRNRVVVTAGVAVLAALLFGIFSARRSERVATAEAQHARMEADSFQNIASFLMDGFLPAQPAQDAEWQAHARNLIDAQALRVQRQFADSDHVRANLLDTLGQVCLRLDLHDDAERLMRDALAIREKTFGRGSLEYALSLRSLGQRSYRVGDYAEAAALLEEALAIHRASESSPHASVDALANDLATCLRNLGRDAEAESLHREALALRRAAGDGTLPVAESLNNLAAVHLGRAEIELAITELREALSIRDSILGASHPLTVQTISNLASVLWRHGDKDEARAAIRRAELGYRELGGDGEEGLGLVLANLATMQIADKDLDGAASSLEEGLALQSKRLGREHPQVAATLTQLAQLEHARHRDDAACGYWDEVVRMRRDPSGPPRGLFEALIGYSVFLTDLGEHERAVQCAEEAIALHRARDLGDAVALGRAEFILGNCLARLGQRDAAVEHLKEADRLLDANPATAREERARVQRALEELDARDGE